MEAFAENTDVHALTAQQVMRRDEVSKADRQAAKAIGFGPTYGMGATGLRRYAKSSYGVEMTDAEAEAYRERFFEAYSGLRAWHRRQPDHAIATRTLGGRRRQAILRHTDKLNSPVQGTGADMLKVAMGLLFESRRHVPGIKLVLAVHDELVLEVPAERKEEAAGLLRRCMVEAA